MREAYCREKYRRAVEELVGPGELPHRLELAYENGLNSLAVSGQHDPPEIDGDEELGERITAVSKRLGWPSTQGDNIEHVLLQAPPELQIELAEEILAIERELNARGAGS